MTRVDAEGARSARPIRPAVLILASRFDLAVDFVVSQLRRRHVSYLRLNSEDLPESVVSLDPIRLLLEGDVGGVPFSVDNTCLKSVYYRRPVFLRSYGAAAPSGIDWLDKEHWATFVRNLMLFDDARWLNHPKATYYAEHKAVQLANAHAVGFDVPATTISNSPSVPSDDEEVLAVKGLDTVLFRDADTETFGFTSLVETDTVASAGHQPRPIVVQSALLNKVDLRVTVVDERVFCASVTRDEVGVHGDWRVSKSDVEFRSFELPDPVLDRCRKLVRRLGLRFGAIDLALQDGQYYFLEVNPTGEWAWLIEAADLPIDAAIADALSQSS